MHAVTLVGEETATHHNVRAILRRSGFRRLLSARVVSQVADGWFQAGLAGSVFFNPERAANAFEITAAFTVLLLPYSVVGPFVGVFLDRWSRRSSLAVANLARAALVVPAAICVWFAQYNVVFLLAALGVVALNRFFLAGISAAVPHVVDPPRLVTANSFSSTAGTVCYSVSLGAAGLTAQLLGTHQHDYALVSIVGTVCYLASAVLLFTSFRPDALGPDDADRPSGSVLSGARDTVVGMVDGLRHLARRPAASAVVAAQAGHRLLFGVLTLTTLLLYRNHYSNGVAGDALVALIPVAAAGAAGALVAAVITPPLVRRIGSVRWLVALAAGVAVLSPACGLPFIPALTVAAAFVVSLGAQGTKIITDTTLQVEADDDYRGRVFSINDTGFNLFFVAGLLIGTVILPDNGVSVAAILGTGVGYGLIALGYGAASRRIARG
jgi:MFS family permease